MKRAIITGLTGQDGSYLAELLLSKGYEVYGFVRRETYERLGSSSTNISHIIDDLNIISVSITDALQVYKAIDDIRPHEFYHLAGHTFVSYDMSDELHLMNVNFNSTLYISSVLKEKAPDCKLFFAGSSEMFGNPETSPQSESTPFNPKSLYGISKVSSYYLLKNFREKEQLFFVTGIMYNHESPRRGSQFVTKKIVSNAVRIKLGLQKELELGNLDAVRDWGYAPDYVNAMWLALQQSQPEDYIVASGKTHSVREFVKIVFEALGLDYKDHVVVSQRFFRKSENIPLCGCPQKIKEIGWEESMNLDQIIGEMIEHEMALKEKGH